ncbi:MAG TPA: IPT/TIG domain-containing protein, partial [Xanthomonadales bacterium]|nr:IPT/TIG domain-containing protein [Xanthomonadales bacterium]
GEVYFQSCLDALDNAGTLELNAGTTQLLGAGVDTGQFVLNGSSKLWLASAGFERVLGSTASISQAAGARTELWGRLRVDGASRTLDNFDTRPSGVLFGPAAITLTGNPKWMGSIEGIGVAETVTVPSGSTLASDFVLGGDFTLNARRLIIDGELSIILRRLRLEGGAIIDNNGTVSFSTSPAGQARMGCLTGPGCGTLNNNGLITASSNTLVSVLEEGINYFGSGAITSTSGRMVVHASGSFDGTYTATGVRELEFSRQPRLFTPSAVFTAGSNFIFGDTSGTLPVNQIQGCLAPGSNASIFDSRLQLECGGPTSFAQLRMERGFSGIIGPSPVVVTAHFEWGAGSLLGSAGTETFELANGATATFAASAGLANDRVLWDRQFINHGTITWTAHNDTVLQANALFDNASDGSVVINLIGSAPGFVPGWTAIGVPQLVNHGLYHVVLAAEHSIDVPFDNPGTFRVSDGMTYLTGPGSDGGSYDLNGVGAALRLQGASANRTLAAAGSIAGVGGLGLDFSAQLQVNGALNVGVLAVSNSSVVRVDSPTAALVGQLVLGSAGVLSGDQQIDVSGGLSWNGGDVTATGVAPAPLRLLPGSNSTLSGIDTHTLSRRTLRIDGALLFADSEVLVPSGEAGRVHIGVSGSLDFAAASGSVSLRCAVMPCVAELENSGLLRQLGAAVPDLQLSSPLAMLGGSLQVGGGGLQVSGIAQSGGVIDVLAGAALQSATVTLTGGDLRGGGDVQGDVINTAGSVRPGTSPGTLSIFGDYTQGASGTLVMEVAGNVQGSGFDHLFSNAAVSLDGTLTVVDAGYTPLAPEALNLVFGDISLSGTFASTNVPYAGYQISYGANSVDLTPAGGVPLVVNSLADPGTGTCDVAECTLREAITAANLLPDADAIHFDIPLGQCTGPGGACVIVPLSLLPQIATPMLIDGYTQVGAVPNSQAPSLGLGSNATLKVELDGTSVPEFCGDGLVINAPGQLVAIRGLAIHHYCGGIVTFGPGDANYSITGNFIGLRADGTAAPRGNIVGISIQGGTVAIGDTSTPASGTNVISGNVASGISISALAPLSGALIRGNLIGTTPSGMAALANGQHGIIMTTASQIPGIFIGGDQPDYRNIISGNAQDGLRFDCSAPTANCFDGARAYGNWIGLAVDGSPLGNLGNGVHLSAMNGGRVDIGGVAPGQGNAIAHNGGNGVLATFGGVGRAALLRNDIFGNAQLGIDLGADGRTVNDAGDADSGPNGLLNFPSFSNYSLAPMGDAATLDVLLDTPDIGGNYPAQVDFYLALGDQPGIWLGSTSCAQPNVNCPASFSFPPGVILAPDDAILGIVTDAFGKSSEASFYVTATAVTLIAPEPSPVGTPYTVNVEVSSAQPFAPLGAVAIDDGAGNSCTAPLLRISNGLSGGSCQLPSLAPAGSRTISAQYVYNSPLPARPFTSSSGSVAHSIAGLPPVVTAISPNNGTTAGGTVVTLTGTDFAIGATAVNFGAAPATSVSCASTIQCVATSPAGSGVVSVRATTAAGTSADTPADDYTYIAPPLPTVTAISGIAPNVSVVGQPYVVSVSVTESGSAVTLGTVQVRQLSDGATCSFALASASSCSLVANSAVTTAVRASYLGAGLLLPSQSASTAHAVDRADTSVLIVSDTPDPSQVLDPVLVTADVSVTAPGAGTPTGEVLITDGSASCTFNLPDRSCALTPKALGVATLEARYLGDANFNGSIDSEAHTIVVDGADLSIVKRNGLRLIPGGQPSTYILLVSNAGPQSVVNARVTDILPPQLADAAWTCSASAGASCPASGTGTLDALVSLPAGSSVSFALTVTAQATPEQVVSNRATVTPPLNAPDPLIENNESTDTDPIGILGTGFETENE